MNASWRQFEAEAPEFAAFVRQRIDDHGLAFLATLAADGSPRISGLEPVFAGDHLWLAMMPNSVKGADLRRDGRFALHNASIDKDVARGDVKIHGVATLSSERGGDGSPDVGAEADLFRASLSRVSSIQVRDNHLVIRTWKPGAGVVTRRRQ